MRARSAAAAMILIACPALSLSISSAHARPGGWGASSWERPGDENGWARPRSGQRGRSATPDRSREGRIDASRFADDPAHRLGHGAIAVVAQADENSEPPATNPLLSSAPPAAGAAMFEAALVDQLVRAGYDTAQTGGQPGQIAELRVTRRVIAPAETRRKPVSGEAAMSVGNRGAAYGMAVNVDLSKPLPALVSTRIDARIRDGVGGKVIWEGHAEVATREGDRDWTEQTIATRLSAALFDGFPGAAP